METVTAFMTLLLVMDPLGNIPVFLSALKDVPDSRRQKVILRELLIALLVLITFLFAGQYLLNLLGLSQEAIRIAGAIVLFLIALRMIFPQQGGIMGESLQGEPFIVPLAIPCVAGPSTLAVLMLMANSEGERTLDWILALCAAWLVSSLILLASTPLSRVLGQRGLIAVERLMGMILVMISVQMCLDGLANLLPAAGT
ncbi:NAAT family transporter [Exilibacterium tricleocarpae]|uniref:UPF0056 membrane protein n=2 Tax=Exilibacterium tricleocarpae TaxID=2591008 RepID=A0A545U4B4_9GAMM|nr:MarC family protein [Exilibacterium tricleocarpae]TQV84310.1 NAAT family transporter [Exilibacterium tricleocarpae]